jgi:hypothetical protein
MTVLFSILAILSSLVGLLLPPIQALFPRISLFTYYRQRLVRRLLALTGLLLLIPVWILSPSLSTGILTLFFLFLWLVSEFVMTTGKLIPPLDDPPALPASLASLPAETQVMGIVLNGHAHAWPLGILIPHHIINDSIHATPVTAAYCPACRSGFVFDPIVQGQRLTFEPVSVRRRNMAMRDRETGTLWQHETGVALMGKYTGHTLPVLGGEFSNWKTWYAEHPDTTLCALPPGYRHPSPLGPIFARLLDHGPEHLVGPGLHGLDQRLPQHDFIAGIVVDGLAMAYPLELLKQLHLIHDRISDTSLVIFYDPASDRVRCFSTAALPPGTSFEFTPGLLVAPATGHSWDLSGLPLGEGFPALASLPVTREWWLAWSEYHPGTVLHLK